MRVAVRVAVRVEARALAVAAEQASPAPAALARRARGLRGARRGPARGGLRHGTPRGDGAGAVFFFEQIRARRRAGDLDVRRLQFRLGLLLPRVAPVAARARGPVALEPGEERLVHVPARLLAREAARLGDVRAAPVDGAVYLFPRVQRLFPHLEVRGEDWGRRLLVRLVPERAVVSRGLRAVPSLRLELTRLVERDAKPVGGGEFVALPPFALGDERGAEDGGADHPVGRALRFPFAQDGAVDVVGVVRAVLAAELRARGVDVLLAVAGVCRGVRTYIERRK